MPITELRATPSDIRPSSDRLEASSDRPPATSSRDLRGRLSRAASCRRFSQHRSGWATR